MSATAVKHRPALLLAVGFGLLTLSTVAAGGFALWYRAYYNTWPGQDARARVHWCERDYQTDGGGPMETWRQVSAESRWSVRDVGRYPPLGFPRQELFAAIFPDAQPGSCAAAVYVRISPDRYLPYVLQGGP